MLIQVFKFHDPWTCIVSLFIYWMELWEIMSEWNCSQKNIGVYVKYVIFQSVKQHISFSRRPELMSFDPPKIVIQSFCLEKSGFLGSKMFSTLALGLHIPETLVSFDTFFFNNWAKKRPWLLACIFKFLKLSLNNPSGICCFTSVWLFYFILGLKGLGTGFCFTTLDGVLSVPWLYVHLSMFVSSSLSV